MDSETSKRIIGNFRKQQWDKDDNIERHGDEKFDATNHVLLMAPQAIRELEDSRSTTDEIGLAHIQWSGPHEVEITDSICEYFGVEQVMDITDEAVAEARNRVNPVPPDARKVRLAIDVSVNVVNGASLDEFVEDLEYTIRSNTPGVVVRNTEITDMEIPEPVVQRPRN